MQVVAVYMSQTALFKTLNLFPPEKALVAAERAKGSYAMAPFFAAKLLAELPVASLFPLLFSTIVYPMTGLQPSVRPPPVKCSRDCLCFHRRCVPHDRPAALGAPTSELGPGLPPSPPHLGASWPACSPLCASL